MSGPSRPLRVLVDATIVKPGLGGIRTYIVELTRHLARRDDIELTVVAGMTEAFEEISGIRLIKAPPATSGFAARALWREYALGRIARVTGTDVLAAPVPEVPLRGFAVPSVVTIHDLSQILAPRYYGRAKYMRFLLGTYVVVRRAARIVCVSQATREALHGFFAVDGQRVVVVELGPQNLRVTASRVGQRHRGRRPYALYVGTLQPQKNVVSVVRSLVDLDLDLVVVGPQSGRQEQELRRVISDIGVKDRVRFEGFVSTTRLDELYLEAMVVVLPSLIEGFGIPVLEAMAAGIPVVASDIRALREVGGDAASYVPRPLDPASWAEVLARAMEEPAERRDARVVAGHRRLAKYAWEAIADRYASVLFDAAAAPPRRDKVRRTTGPLLRRPR